MKNFGFVISFILFFAGSLNADVVRLESRNDGWILKVGNQDFFVKGVGCNTAVGKEGEDLLRMAKEMGANAVRTWGITPRPYFDKAHTYGLKVDAGVWFNPVRENSPESYLDLEFCAKLKNETLAYVREMKDHPALLLWNLGNEVFAFTEDDSERKAFAVFLEDLIREVHKEDPDHPVVYACNGFDDFRFLASDVPSLDIIGLNTYAGVGYFLNWFNSNKINKPLLVTEFGPAGAWDVMKDANQLPNDPFDHFKARQYEDRWKEIERMKIRLLGGFAFVLGEQPNQYSYTWWNINFKELKRQGYWALYQLFTGKTPANQCPKIKLLKLDQVKNLKPREWVHFQLEVSDPEQDGLIYKYFFTDIPTQVIFIQPPRYLSRIEKFPEQGQLRFKTPEESGTYRIYILIEDGKGNVAVANRTFQVN